MSHNLHHDTVADVMQRYPVTIRAQDSLADAASLFEQYQFHAAPVTDQSGQCIGILTSGDLVRFEAQREAFENQFHRGAHFDQARYGNESASTDAFQFDQVGAQMSKNFRAVAGGVSLMEAVSIMHSERLHHLLVLDGLGKPSGILSTLDILGRLLQGEV